MMQDDTDSGLPDFLAQHRTAILQLAVKHGAHNVRVFGSVVHGKTRDDSDIDLLVDVTGVTSPWFPAGLIQDLQEYLGRNVDVVTENALHPVIRNQVLRSGIPL